MLRFTLQAAGSIALVTLLALGVNPLSGQAPVSVIGTVIDQQTLTPLPGASIAILERRVETRSENDGNFALPPLAPGTVTLRVSAPGYSTAIEEVEITANEIAFVQFPLIPLSAVLDELFVRARVGDLDRDEVAVGGDRLDTAQTAADLLSREIPGLSFSRGSGAIGSGSQINIRGVSSISQSTIPAIFLDGVRLNAADSGPSNMRTKPSLAVLETISASQIKSIRVLRGSSAAARYGDSANGVILIETRDQ